MDEYDIKYVEKMSGLKTEYRNTLAEYYRKLPEHARIYAHTMSLNLLNEGNLVDDGHSSTEHVYVFFLKALKKMKLSESHRREQDEEMEKLGMAIRIWRAKERKRRKPNVKGAFIEIHYHELRDLRGKDLSWRELETYIQNEHKVKIGFSYIRKIFREIEYERQFENR